MRRALSIKIISRRPVSIDRVRLGESCDSIKCSKALIRSVEQPPRDHLCLNFGSAFKNIEDPRVAQNARNWKLEGKAVAAVYLHGVVGRRPGDPCGEQFCHAGIEIAAPS